MIFVFNYFFNIFCSDCQQQKIKLKKYYHTLLSLLDTLNKLWGARELYLSSNVWLNWIFLSIATKTISIFFSIFPFVPWYFSIVCSIFIHQLHWLRVIQYIQKLHISCDSWCVKPTGRMMMILEDFWSILRFEDVLKQTFSKSKHMDLKVEFIIQISIKVS